MGADSKEAATSEADDAVGAIPVGALRVAAQQEAWSLVGAHRVVCPSPVDAHPAVSPPEAVHREGDEPVVRCPGADAKRPVMAGSPQAAMVGSHRSTGATRPAMGSAAVEPKGVVPQAASRPGAFGRRLQAGTAAGGKNRHRRRDGPMPRMPRN